MVAVGVTAGHSSITLMDVDTGVRTPLVIHMHPNLPLLLLHSHSVCDVTYKLWIFLLTPLTQSIGGSV